MEPLITKDELVALAQKALNLQKEHLDTDKKIEISKLLLLFS